MEKDLENILSKYQLALRDKDKVSAQKKLWIALFLDQQFSWIAKTGEFMTLSDDELKQLRNKKKIYPLFLNLIKPVVLVVASQLTQRQAVVRFVPKGQTMSSYYSSKATNLILDAYRQTQDYLKKDRLNALWMTITGDSYKWVHPEPSGEYISIPRQNSDGSLVKNLDGSVVYDLVPLKVNIVVDVLNWEQVFFPPGYLEIDNMPWVIIARYINKDLVEEQFNVKLDISSKSNLEGKEKTEDKVLILDYLEKPSAKYPTGRYFILAYEANKILKASEFPYWKINFKTGTRTWGGYRLRHFQYIPSLTLHWGQGLPSPVAEIQKRINHILTAWATNAILTMGVKLLFPDNVPIPENILDNTPAPVKYPADKHPPQYLNPSMISPDVLNLLRFLISTFERIIGIHELSLGAQPEQRLPNVAIQYLVDLDMSKFRFIFENYAETEAQVAWDIYHSIRQFGQDYAKSVLGADKILEYNEFINDNPDDYEMIAERESNIPESRSGVINTIIEILKASQGQAFRLGTEQGMSNFLMAIDTGWSRQMIKDRIQATELVREENRRLMNGESLEPHPLHNHTLHIEEHRALFNSPDYLTRIKDTLIEDRIQEHIDKHIHYLQVATQSQEQSPLQVPNPQQAGLDLTNIQESVLSKLREGGIPQ